jgi:hypothetical protein
MAADPINAIRVAAGVEMPAGEHLKPAGGAAGTPAIFFDNDADRIAEVRSMCNNIELVRVPETAAAELAGKNVNMYPALWPDHNLAENSYYKIHAANGLAHSDFDIKSGMQFPEFIIINDWVARTEGLGFARKAIFDWDRTISMIEGAIIPDKPAFGPPGTLRERMGAYAPFSVASGGPGIAPENYIEDLLIYVCGGINRLNNLRAMFAFLRSRGIMIVVLTNSPACLANKLPYFQEVLNALVGVPGYQPRVVCGPLFHGHKGHAMRSFVPALCTGAMAGGRRVLQNGGGSRRTVKNKKHRSKSRKAKHRLKVLH